MAITGSAAAATVQSTSTDPIVGLAITAVASDSTDGHKFTNDGRTRLRVVNGSGSSTTVTIETRGTVSGYAIADFTEAVAAGVTKEFGPFNKSVFNDSNDLVWFGVSADTSVTFSVVN